MHNNSPARSAIARLLARRETNGGEFSAPAKVKNACLLRSPCFTAFVLPNGAPAPARFQPQLDLDCWFDFFIFRTLPAALSNFNLDGVNARAFRRFVRPFLIIRIMVDIRAGVVPTVRPFFFRQSIMVGVSAAAVPFRILR